jgi:hypothetical protein
MPKNMANNKNEVVTFIARKIPVIVAKTFWQQYGMFVMLGGFFLFNQWVQKKAKAAQANQAQADPNATPSATTPAVEADATTSNKKKD